MADPKPASLIWAYRLLLATAVAFLFAALQFLLAGSQPAGAPRRGEIIVGGAAAAGGAVLALVAGGVRAAQRGPRRAATAAALVPLVVMAAGLVLGRVGPLVVILAALAVAALVAMYRPSANEAISREEGLG